MRKAVYSVILFAAIAYPGDSSAQRSDSFETARSLGTLLGSEGQCQLEFDLVAIEQFIDDNVRDDDMGFLSSLSLYRDTTQFELREMSESAVTAHCRQVHRVARSYGFVD